MNLFFHPFLLLQTDQPHGLCVFPSLVLLSLWAFDFHLSARPLTTCVLALAFVCLGLSGWGPPPGLSTCHGQVWQLRNWGGSIKRAVAVTINLMFKCGDCPRKLWTRFSSEHGNLHPSSGYITDSGARQTDCVQKTNSDPTINGCMALCNLLNVSELLFPHLWNSNRNSIYFVSCCED